MELGGFLRSRLRRADRKKQDSQEPKPRELGEYPLLERAARDLDLEIAKARNLRGLRERRVRLQSRRSAPEVRRPLLGLDALGLSADDVRSGTLPEWLHAVGDAGPGAPLTHMGKYEARVLGSKLAGADEAPAPANVPVPQVVFTDPQVAAVGCTEAQARESGLDVVVAQVPYGSAAGSALLRDDVDGTAQLVVDRGAGVVVGASFVGPEAAELLHAATIAIVGQVPVSLLRHAVPAYPTVSELWLRLLEQLPRDLR